MYIFVVVHVNRVFQVLKPQLIMKLKIRENITFLCQAMDEPVPDIIWYFNDVHSFNNDIKLG